MMPHATYSVKKYSVKYNDNDNDNDNEISLFRHKFIQHY